MTTEHVESPDDALRPALAGPAIATSPSTSGDARAWLIRISLHLMLALLFWAVVWASRNDTPEEFPPLQLNIDQSKQPPPPAPVDVRQTDTLPLNDEVVDPSPQSVIVQSDPQVSTDNNIDDIQPQGDPTQVSTTPISSNANLTVAIGVHASNSGLFGRRGNGGNHQNAGPAGGSRGSESAVRGALQWFKRHQSANGMWDAEHYQANCSEMPKCEPGSIAPASGSDVTVALTSYAVLCYLGAGYDHQTPSQFRATVRKGLEYLRSVQKADGLLGERNYEHAVASSALIEAYAMTNDPELKGPASRAVAVILARQNKDAKASSAYGGTGLGWDYREPNAARNDASVTGWNVMALKSALAAGLDVGTGLKGARNWLERSWKATNPNWKMLVDPYTASSDFAYTWDATSDKVEVGAPGADAHDMAAVGGMCAVFLGHHADDMMLQSLANHAIAHQLPTAYPCNTYYLYYNTYTMFQVGGKRWETWNGVVRDLLVKAQRQGTGCYAGSWDWEGTRFHGNDIGRVLSTAYCCLCLEVYYRDGRELKERTL